MICPTCRAKFDPATSEVSPFCSPRCKQIDLGRWLDERHSMPNINLEDEDESDEPMPPGPARDTDSQED